MELKLVNGDYQPDGHGGLRQAEEEVRLRGSELTVTLIRAGTERELRLPLGEVTA
nr:MAG TPA: hypothetical protein [Caudoviricetes sp.]